MKNWASLHSYLARSSRSLTVWSKSVLSLAAVSGGTGPLWLKYSWGWFWVLWLARILQESPGGVGTLSLVYLGRLGQKNTRDSGTYCLPPRIAFWVRVACHFPVQPHLPLHNSSIHFPLNRTLFCPFLKAQPITNCIKSRIMLSWGALLQGFTLELIFASNSVSWIGFPRDSTWDRGSSACDLLGESSRGKPVRVWRKLNGAQDTAEPECGLRWSLALRLSAGRQLL